jgi:hypothetical protein
MRAGNIPLLRDVTAEVLQAPAGMAPGSAEDAMHARFSPVKVTHWINFLHLR